MTESSPSSHGMSRKLPNAVPLDLYLTSSSDVVRELACYVYEQYVQQRNCPSFEKLYPTISCILLNLLRAYKSDTSRYVRFSRRTKDYTESRYNRSGISYRSMDRVVKALDRTLIEFEVGQTSYVQGELGRQSVMRATPTLIDLCSVRFEVLPEMIERSVEEEVIILKGEKQTVRIVDGRRIRAAPLLDYDDSDEPPGMRKNLAIINERLGKADLELAISYEDLELVNEYRIKKKKKKRIFVPPPEYDNCRLRRIFNNGSFQEGGRFYGGWWQSIGKEFRAFIQIDGRITKEKDYSGMHIQILYAQAGSEMPEDPYALPNLGAGFRPQIKAALNTAINAQTTNEAKRAVQDMLRSQKQRIPAPYETPTKLLDALETIHVAIADEFGTGAGVHLQYIDSQIAEQVMLELGNQGIVALPVHDSFIVAEEYEDQLTEAMNQAFTRVVGAACGIEGKAPIWEQIDEPPPYPMRDIFPEDYN